MKTNMKKRTISSVVSFAMLLSSAPVAFAELSQRDDVDLRVGLMGDVHLQTGNFNGENYLIKALEATKNLSGGKLDAMVLTGDVVYQTDANYTDHYDRLYADLNTYVPGVPVVYSMGNHEYMLNNHNSANKVENAQQSRSIFAEKTGQSVNYHYETKDGYHFITAAADDYNGVYSDETQQWLMQEIDSAIAEDVNKPVFVSLHHPVDGTVVENIENGYNDTFEAYIKTKPQVINLTAHYHVAAQIPQTIYQDGFTAFQTPLTAIGGTENWKCNAGETEQVHQGAMLEVTDNVVSIYKYDLDTQEYIGEPWVIDVPAIVADRSDADASNDNDNCLYSADKRSNPATPVWEEGSALTVKKKANSLDVVYPDTATVAEQPNQQDGFIAGYKVELVSNEGKVLFDKTYPSDYYKAVKSGSYTQTITGLGYSNEYKVNVYPMTPWGTFGNALSKNVTTAAETVSSRAITYEFEDVADTDSAKKTILDNAYAHDGALLVSGAGYGKAYLNQNDNPSFDFTINVPTDDTYKIEYVLGERTNGAVSAVTLDIDGSVVGTNSSSYTEDLSLNGTFPWSYIPLRKYTTEMALTAGEHTVTLTVGDCQKSGNTWLYLFAADYIRLTPKTVALPEGVTEIDLIRNDNGTLRTGVSASTDFEGYDPNFNIASVIDGNVYSYWFSAFKLKNPYLTVDLGAVRCITEINYLPPNGYNANVAGANDGGWYYKAGMEIQLSNSKTFDEYVTVASLPYTQAQALKLGETLDAKLDGSINKYRYIRIYQPNCDVIGATEISVKGYELSESDYNSNVKVESVSFTSNADAVTNVDTDELIQIKFSDSIDLSTATSESIYFVDSTNATQKVNPIIIDDTTVAVYPGELLPAKTYNVVVSGLLDASGVPMAPYKSAESFKTDGKLAAATYDKDTVVTNITTGKTLDIYTLGVKTGNLNTWTNGIDQSEPTSGNDIYKLPYHSSSAPVYGVLDLEEQTDIVSVGIRSTAVEGHAIGLEVWGTNDISAIANGDSSIEATAEKLAVFAPSYFYNDTYMMYTESVEGSYRYIIYKKPQDNEQSIKGFWDHTPVYASEVYVYKRVDNTPVTIAGTPTVTDGMEKVTNVSNCRPEEGYSYVGKPMEIILSDNADMSTVTNKTITVNNGKSDVAYTPVIDGKTVKIDLAELDSNLTYTVTVTRAVKSTDGAPGSNESFTFSTGLIAKVAYEEGKIIRNAAFGKTAWKSAEADGTTSLKGLTDRVEKDSPQFNADHKFPDYADKDIPGIFGIIDLGNEYEVKSVGVRGNDANSWWNYYSIDFYCMDEAVANGAELTNNIGKIGKDLCMLTTVPTIKAEGTGRYIMFKKTDTSATLKEVYVFVSVDEDAADVFFTHNTEANTITANAENFGENVLILASYDEAGNIGQVSFAENGAATVDAADGFTYKAFLWDSFVTLNPVAEALIY